MQRPAPRFIPKSSNPATTLLNARLPNGRYRTRLLERHTISDGARRELQLTFEVTLGDYAGTRIVGRFWSPLMVARAGELDWAKPVDIAIRTKTSLRGQVYPIVHDFLQTGAWTAAEAVTGVPDDPAAAAEVLDQTVAPERLITDYEADRLLDDIDEKFGPPDIPTPIQAEVWEELLATVGPFASDHPRPTHRDHHGYDGAEQVDVPADADEDAKRFRWVICAGEDPGATPACVDWDEAAARHAAAEAASDATNASRMSVCEYSDETKTYLAIHGSLRRYVGVAWSRWLMVSLLGERGLMDALAPARKVLDALETVGVPRRQVAIFNVHNRGFRLLIPSGCANAYPQMGFEAAVGHFWQLLLNAVFIAPGQLQAGPDGVPVPSDLDWHTPLDRSLYGPNAMVTAVNTAATGTGYYTVWVSSSELQNLSLAELEKLARKPRPFNWPSWRAAPIPLLEDCWQYAVNVEQSRSKRFATILGSEPWIFGDSFRFVNAGAPHGDAKRCLFRAALNFLRCGAPVPLIAALLGPGAALSGLDREETHWLIAKAVERHLANGGTVVGEEDDADL